MKRIDFSNEDLTERVPNKYAAAIIIANRAKAIRENPGDVEDDERKYKPTVIAIKEFKEDRLKYSDFDIEKINQGE
jgi:DNA-directed RNA polymerase omega subunit